MKIQILQHSIGTPPGSLTEWLDAKGRVYTITKVFEGEPLPSLDSFDWLILMGGPMSVDDVATYPWLADEKKLIRSAIDNKKSCLGLCLGGQLLAQALGAEVKKHEHWEVGWHPIFMGPDRLNVFQWHQDTFDIPAQATRVATNKICENQAFTFGENIVGLQFHPEATEAWIRECSEHVPYPEGAHVQAPAAMIDDLVFITPMKKWFFSLLDRMEEVTRHALQKPPTQGNR